MKKTTLLMRFVSVFMASVLIAAFIPAQAISSDGGKNKYEGMSVFAVEEDQTKRGQFEKHYLCSDGTFVSVTYPEAVHYLDDNNVWQDVNQPLTFDPATSEYVSRGADFEVAFSEVASSTGMARITQNGYALSWGVQASEESESELSEAILSPAVVGGVSESERIDISASSAVAEVAAVTETARDSASERVLTDSESFALPHTSSRISYADIFPGREQVSLKYTVYYNKVEEDIIISEKGDLRSVSLNMDVGTLTPVVNADGSVDIVDADNKMQFRIGIPYMVDADYSVCNDIQVTAVKNGTSCVITYTPDAVWFGSADRVYPILLDPSVTTNDYVSNIEDTYVEENTTANHSSEQYLYISKNGNNRRKAIVRVTKLPTIDASMPIISASLTMTAQYAPFSNVALAAGYLDAGVELDDYDFDIATANNYTYTAYSYLNTGNSRQVVFDFTPHIYEMYNDLSFDQEEGVDYHGDFVIEYANDAETAYVYPFCSSECTTVSNRPVFTVRYGYTLPAGMLDGDVYSFRNYQSYSYMSVNGTTPANGSNIYQLGSDEDTALTTQKFKLEYVSSTGGYRLRSMASSNGNGMVVDISRTGGELQNGRNVQLYAATDPLSQEWLIVPVDYDVFRIVPRGNMALTLTAYGDDDGTNTGKTATSAGNIFVQTLTESNGYQKWYIYNNNDAEVSTLQFRAVVETGDYYLTNGYTGRYLHSDLASKTVSGKCGTINSLGDETVKWKIVNLGDGYCTIQRSDMPHYYLASEGAESGSAVKVSSSTSERIPDNYKWSIRIANGRVLIQHKASGLYLSGINSETDKTTLCLYALGTPGTTAYAKQVWRIAGEDYYVELGYGVTFNDIALDIGESKTASINKRPSNAIWASYKDFEYCFISEGNGHVSYDVDTNRFTRLSYGTVRVLATHKTTGISRTFYILDSYPGELVTTFGFTVDEALLICSVYDRIDKKFSEESSTERAWKSARLLSEFCYDSPIELANVGSVNAWDSAAGTVTDEATIDSYFVNTLGYTLREVNSLRSAIIRNHNDSQTIDFAHMQYSLAARLAYTLDKDTPLSNICAQFKTGNPTLYSDETISYLGGWLGDAVIRENNGTTSMPNDDYCADLDAENIYQLILAGRTTISAANSYYAGLSAASTRATVFLRYIPYETVKNKVFWELIDAQLDLARASAEAAGNTGSALVYSYMMSNEEYHWNTLRSDYPDTYDFLKSLSDEKATITHYQ